MCIKRIVDNRNNLNATKILVRRHPLHLQIVNIKNVDLQIKKAAHPKRQQTLLSNYDMCSAFLYFH